VEGNGDSTWKGWRVIGSLTEQYNRDVGEDEMLGEPKEDGRTAVKLRTGSRILNCYTPEEEKSKEFCLYFTENIVAPLQIPAT
jgi:hypothetical protein